MSYQCPIQSLIICDNVFRKVFEDNRLSELFDVFNNSNYLPNVFITDLEMRNRDRERGESYVESVSEEGVSE